jgi:hypothetical protein
MGYRYLYEFEFLKSLFFTVSIETLVLIVLVKYLFKSIDLKLSRLIFAGFSASILTLPYLWFIFPVFLSSRLLYLIIGESLVVLIESVFYFFTLKTSVKNVLLISVICNLASFLIGLMI